MRTIKFEDVKLKDVIKVYGHDMTVIGIVGVGKDKVFYTASKDPDQGWPITLEQFDQWGLAKGFTHMNVWHDFTDSEIELVIRAPSTLVKAKIGDVVEVLFYGEIPQTGEGNLKEKRTKIYKGKVLDASAGHVKVGWYDEPPPSNKGYESTDTRHHSVLDVSGASNKTGFQFESLVHKDNLHYSVLPETKLLKECMLGDVIEIWTNGEAYEIAEDHFHAKSVKATVISTVAGSGEVLLGVHEQISITSERGSSRRDPPSYRTYAPNHTDFEHCGVVNDYTKLNTNVRVIDKAPPLPIHPVPADEKAKSPEAPIKFQAINTCNLGDEVEFWLDDGDLPTTTKTNKHVVGIVMAKPLDTNGRGRSGWYIGMDDNAPTYPRKWNGVNGPNIGGFGRVGAGAEDLNHEYMPGENFKVAYELLSEHQVHIVRPAPPKPSAPSKPESPSVEESKPYADGKLITTASQQALIADAVKPLFDAQNVLLKELTVQVASMQAEMQLIKKQRDEALQLLMGSDQTYLPGDHVSIAKMYEPFFGTCTGTVVGVITSSYNPCPMLLVGWKPGESAIQGSLGGYEMIDHEEMIAVSDIHSYEKYAVLMTNQVQLEQVAGEDVRITSGITRSHRLGTKDPWGKKSTSNEEGKDNGEAYIDIDVATNTSIEAPFEPAKESNLTPWLIGAGALVGGLIGQMAKTSEGVRVAEVAPDLAETVETIAEAANA